jgi:tRNA pseudouridine13 synthase
MAERSDIDGRPAKRARLDPATDSAALAPITAATPATELPKAPIDSGPTAVDGDLEREVRAGITEYVCPDNLGFTGVLKHRYTDFLVNEIGLDGKVLHLRLAGVEKKEVEKEVKKEVTNGSQSESKAETAPEQKVEVKTEDASAEAPSKPEATAEAIPENVDTSVKANGHEDTTVEKPEDQQVRANFSAAFAPTHTF